MQHQDPSGFLLKRLLVGIIMIFVALFFVGSGLTPFTGTAYSDESKEKESAGSDSIEDPRIFRWEIIDSSLSQAEAGDADAQFDLGRKYETGDGVDQDYAESVKWYTKAAEQGHADAQFFLGLMHYGGEGVPQDYREALKWYTKAAEQGHAEAQLYLGMMYDYGQGVPRITIKHFIGIQNPLSRDILMLNTFWALCMKMAKVSRKTKNKRFTGIQKRLSRGTMEHQEL
jgi:uncharacterized protein